MSSFTFDFNDGFTGFTPEVPADGCTQCGFCLPVCPTFNKSEDHEQSPMGRIRLMRALTAQENRNMAWDKLESCLGCYACETVCPSGVQYGQLLDQSLSRLREQRQMPWITRLMLWLSRKPRLLKFLIQITAVLQYLGIRRLLRDLGIFKLSRLARYDALLGKVNFPTGLSNRLHGQRVVALFRGCFSSVLEQDVQQTAIDVLNTLSIKVVIPEKQTCCGALHRHNGDSATSLSLAQRNITAFNSSEIEAVITTSSGCGAALQHYPEWPDAENQRFLQPVMDITHYLTEVLKQRHINLQPLPLKVAVHVPCSLKQGEGQADAVADLLQSIPELEVQYLSGTPACCGAGGSQMLSHPVMADALRDDVVAEIIQLQPDILLSSNLGCALHLQSGLKQARMDIPLLHPVQLLARAMDRRIRQVGL